LFQSTKQNNKNLFLQYPPPLYHNFFLSIQRKKAEPLPTLSWVKEWLRLAIFMSL